MGLFSLKPIKDLVESSDGGALKLHRHLGPLQLTVLGIGSIIGAGLFSITGIAAADHAGPAIVISFFIAAIGCAFAGLCYSELASMIPVAGSAYTYAYATMGELIAWMIGWDLILEYAVGAAVIAISWSGYLVSFLIDFGIHLPPSITASPWQPIVLHDGSHALGYLNLPALLIVCTLSVIAILGMKLSAVFNTLMVITKVSVALLFIGLGFLYINWDNYVPFLPENTGAFGSYGWSGVARAAGVLFFAFIGFDSISTFAQETRNPQQTLPIGILGSLFICTILYILFSFVMTGLVNYKELNVAAPVALAINKTPFLWLQWFVKIAILTGLTSGILVTLIGQSRILYAMSRDGLLPPQFSRLHPKFRTPWICNIILMIFVGLVSAFFPLTLLGHITSIGTLFAFVVVCVGVMILRYTEPLHPRLFRVPWVPTIPLLGVLFCGAMMFSLGLDTWIRLLVWLLIGLMIYIFYGRHRVLLVKKEKIEKSI